MQQETPAPSVAPPAAESVSTKLPWNVRLLGLASLLNDVASEMIYPLIPTFLIRVLHGTTSQLGGVEGAAETTASLVKLWSGGLSDRAGKRKVFVTVGYALTAFSRPFIAFATAPWQVLVIRSSDRFGKGIRSAPRDALVADSTDPSIRGRAFGFTRAMDHLGAAIGPLLAFAFLWIWPEHFRTLFLLAAVPGLLVVLLVMFGLRERLVAIRADERLGTGTIAAGVASRAEKRFRLTLQPFDRNFRVYLVALVIFTLGNSSDAFLLVRVGELGVPATQLPLLWCAFHIVKSTLSLVAGRAVDHFGPRPLIYVGWIIYAAIYLAFSLATSALQGWIFFLIYGLFYALTEPAERTLVANLVGVEQKGLAFGWFNFATGIAALPSSLIFGALYEWYGGSVAFAWSAVLALVAVIVLAAVRRPDTIARRQ